MRSLLLTAAMVTGIAAGSFAQNLPPEYGWEAGANGGYSVITRPVGPPDVYRGTRTNVVRDYSLRASYYFNWRWMISAEVGDRRWETFGQWQLWDRFDTRLKPIDVPFLLAEHAITESVQMNHVIPFYTQFHNFNRANIYFGVQAGMVQTVNDGSRTFSTMNTGTDSSWQYVSGYHYQSGLGYTLGLQGGFIYYIVPRFGVTAELSLRYVNVRTRDINYAMPNRSYHIMHFPQTIGVRYRFGAK